MFPAGSLNHATLKLPARYTSPSRLRPGKVVVPLESHAPGFQLLRRSFHVVQLPQRGGPLVGPGELRTVDTERAVAGPINHGDAWLPAGLLESQRPGIELRRRVHVLDRQHGLHRRISQHAGAPRVVD